MDDQDPNTISTDLIRAQREMNRKALKDDGELTQKEIIKLILQTQDTILMIISIDHPRITSMYADYSVRKKKTTVWEPRVWQIVKEIVMYIILAALGYYLAYITR